MMMMEDTGSKVRVAVRVRPTANFAKGVMNVSAQTGAIDIHTEKKAIDGYVNNAIEDRSYKYDMVMDNTSQESVYELCGSDIVQNVFDGYNGTIMAYGQTGAGKTFTMIGAPGNYKNRGLIPRSISHIFNEINSKPESAITVRVSFVEIYNEEMYDLLSGLPGDREESGSAGSINVKGLSKHVASSEEDALNLLFEGETNRAISSHSLNKTSSRSHCVFTLELEIRSRVESMEKVIVSKLNLVDLAGSERLGKTNSEGITLKEATYINKSLTFLEQVVVALGDKHRDHIPYRQSKLTNMLRDSLGGNCKTTMIANIWGETAQLEETVSTLKFATRMKKVQNRATVNVQQDPSLLVKKYEKEIALLRSELAMHDQLAGQGGHVHEDYTPQQKTAFYNECKSYVAGDKDEIDITTLRQCHEMFRQFRTICQNAEQAAKANAAAAGIDGAGAGGTAADGSPGADGAAGAGEVGVSDGSGFGLGAAGDNAKPNGGAPKVAGGGGGKDKGGGDSKDADGKDGGGGGDGGDDEVPEDIDADGGDASGFSGGKKKDEKFYRPAPADKNAAFAEYKATPQGLSIAETTADNKADLRSKKDAYKECAAAINAAMGSINGLKAKIEAKSASRDSEEDIIDEEEFAFIKQLKDCKVQYKTLRMKLTEIKSDMDAVERYISTSKSQMLTDFEAWYEDTFLPDDNSAKAVQDTMELTGMTGMDAGEEDAFEQFEALELQRMTRDDPEAAAFYAARKGTIARHRLAGHSTSPGKVARQARTNMSSSRK